MKTILLPTDFSDNSKNAVEYAVSMFGGSKVKFILFNAYRIKPVGLEEYVTNIPNFKKESEDGLKKMLAHINKTYRNKKFTVETISKLGYPVQTMEKIVNRKKVDLTVMGTKGASGMREVLIGSITADAIKNLSCPVIAVPEKAKFKKPKNIAFAADFKKSEIKYSAQPLIELAKKFKSEIIILHIRKKVKKMSPEEIRQEIKIEKYFEEIPNLSYTVENSNIAEGIEGFIKTKEADMLAMISRKHNFLENIFNPSVTRKLAMHTEIPLLVLYEKTTKN